MAKKKVAIATFTFLNFGTQLQALGLQKTLEELGYDAEILNFINESGERGKRALIATIKEQTKYYGAVKGMWRVIKELLFVYRQRKDIAKDHGTEIAARELYYQEFMDKNMKYTQTLSGDQLRDAKFVQALPYDVYVAGSDQIWNEKYTGSLDIFFLKVFPKAKKRISYAGSFGKNRLPGDKVQMFKELMDNIETVLVRENAAKNIVENQLGREAHVVLDPTLLHNQEFWRHYAVQPRQVDFSDYVLVYSLNHSTKIYDEAKRIAKKENTKMIVVKRSFCPPHSKRFLELYELGPQHFLWLIMNARMVITNSFHALVFSLIFNRPCYPYLDAAEEVNERLTSLLERVGHQHVVSYEHEGPMNIENKVFDFSKINETLEMGGVYSVSLLKEAIEKE